MAHPLSWLIDRMARAEEEGAFDDLPGAGQPLPEGPVAQDAVLNKLLAEAGAVPPVVALKREIAASLERLKGLTDPADRKAEMAKLADLQMRLGLTMEAHQKWG